MKKETFKLEIPKASTAKTVVREILTHVQQWAVQNNPTHALQSHPKQYKNLPTKI